MSRIFVTGDTHCTVDYKKLTSKKFPVQKNLTKDDYVIIAGDFGAIWDLSAQCKYMLEWYDERSFTTLFVDGNHENFNLLNGYPEETWNGGEIHRISPSIMHLKRGQVFNIGGITLFTFGGASSIDKAYRLSNISWWEAEVPNYAEVDAGLLNLARVDWKVDYVITHTAPTDIVKAVYSDTFTDPTTAMLDNFAERMSFKHWYFGHLHVDQCFGKYTGLYNKIIELGVQEH